MKKISVLMSFLLSVVSVYPAVAENIDKKLAPSPVAAQGVFLSQLKSYDMSFLKMDTYIFATKDERDKFREKESEDETDYSYTLGMWGDDTEKGFWAVPYVSTENIDLGRGIKADNDMYGISCGIDFGMFELEKCDVMFGLYAGYNAAEQAYDGNKVIHNGGNAGVAGMVYVDDFFIGAALNYGISSVKANTIDKETLAGGEENFNVTTTGVALKAGYNKITGDGTLIVQPSFKLSYTAVNMDDYRNAYDVNIKSDTLGVINIEPGVKFILNLSDGFAPYFGVSGVFNINDETKFTADNVSLPELNINPYVKYGFGLSTKLAKNSMVYIQSFFTNGGRNGGELNAGLKLRFGKANNREI